MLTLVNQLPKIEMESIEHIIGICKYVSRIAKTNKDLDALGLILKLLLSECQRE